MVKANDDLRRDDRGHHRHERARPHGSQLYSDHVDPREIEDDIDHTRAAMDETIGELIERFAPRNLLGEGLAIIRASMSGSRQRRRRRHDEEHHEDEEGPGFTQRAAKATGKQLWTILKNHPLPSALITTGVVWMIAEKDRPTRVAERKHERMMRERREEAMRPVGTGYTEGYVESEYERPLGLRGREYSSGAPGQTGGTRERMHEARERISGAAESMRERAGDWGHSARERMADTGAYVTEKASGMKESVREGASTMSRSLKQGVEKTRGVYDRAMEDYPLAIGAAALGVGMLAGWLLPRTQRETEWFGEASEELKTKAREAGREAMHRGSEVTEHAATSAVESIERDVSQQMREHSGASSQDDSGESHKRESTPGADI